jgi:hypothetical protein
MYVSALNNTTLHKQHKQHTTQEKRGREINLKDESALSESATPPPPKKKKNLKDPINHSRLSACYISHTSRPPKMTRAQQMEATPGSLGDD